VQAAALAWFVFSWSGKQRTALASLLRVAVLRRRQPALRSRTHHRRPLTGWDRINAANRQVFVWRLAGVGSTSLAAFLGLTLAISVVRANVIPVAVVTPRRDELPAALQKIENTPSDAAIAYELAEFVKEVRTLSADPVVVRANWIDALDHVTARGAQILNDYARDESPFTKIGRRTVTVAVTKVVQTDENTFEVRWEEQILDNSAAVRRERFMAAISIAFNSPSVSRPIIKNPLGLYVDRFTWWREQQLTN
jgi:type IV secretion system protein TrbF